METVMSESWFRRTRVLGLGAGFILAMWPSGQAASGAASLQDGAVYVLVRAGVTDADEFRRYQHAFLQSVLAYGGEIVLDLDLGPEPPDGDRRVDFVEAYISEVKLPSLAASERWYNSPSYQQLIPLRNRSVVAFTLAFSVERFDLPQAE
jgi:uncharacterized protein (DUF1330 family)